MRAQQLARQLDALRYADQIKPVRVFLNGTWYEVLSIQNNDDEIELFVG